LAAKVAGTSLTTTSHGEAAGNAEQDSGGIIDIPDMDDEEDDELGGLGAGVVEADDPATAASRQATASALKSENRLVSVRTYDCLITYDKYYQTPRMWLVGYNESGQPLKPAEIFEDISSDYAQKTVTVEPFPHGNMSTASIHPCKHASVMKKVIERMNTGVVEEQRRAKAASGDVDKKKKKGWGLGMKKKESEGAVASPPNTSETGEEEGGQDIEGLRVDQYLLIFLKFMASIVPAIEIDATQAV
jgi:ubiquitin-like-conjugating enzyme ATG3